jgi:hypothetical protein
MDRSATEIMSGGAGLDERAGRPCASGGSRWRGASDVDVVAEVAVEFKLR